MIARLITFALSNFTLTLLVIGLLFSLFSLIRRHPQGQGEIVDAFLRWFIFFSIGVSYLYNFVMHVFFAEMVAGFIGWANSPFQYEVGYASLGFAAVGFIAFRQGLAFRTAAIVGPAFFLWGAAGGHIYQIVTAHNFAPGNAGVILWTDIFLPFAGLILLALQRRYPVKTA